MRYLIPYEAIKRAVRTTTAGGEPRVEMSRDDFETIVRLLIQGVDVDEAWYCETYPDIGAAVRSGAVASAKAHFVSDGFFEGRRPYPMAIDEAWYLGQYPDVAEFLREGRLESAQGHFDEDGYREGRLPFAV